MNVIPCMKEWFERNKTALMPPVEPPIPKMPVTHDSTKTSITENEARAIKALSRVTFVPNTFHKRFARDMQSHKELTPRQRATLWRIVVRFRRQIDGEVVAMARREIEKETK